MNIIDFWTIIAIFPNLFACINYETIINCELVRNNRFFSSLIAIVAICHLQFAICNLKFAIPQAPFLPFCATFPSRSIVFPSGQQKRPLGPF